MRYLLCTCGFCNPSSVRVAHACDQTNNFCRGLLASSVKGLQHLTYPLVWLLEHGRAPDLVGMIFKGGKKIPLAAVEVWTERPQMLDFVSTAPGEGQFVVDL